jgi:preprotein translocase subunit YajC
MLISPAYAQAAGGGGFGGMESLLPLVLIFVVFYFLLIRPQQKKTKAHREMLGNLHRGDRVVTNGGLIGKITRVPNDSELILEIADGVKVRVLRGMIAEVSARTERARDRKRDKEEAAAADNDDDDDVEDTYDDEDDRDEDDREENNRDEEDDRDDDDDDRANEKDGKSAEAR